MPIISRNATQKLPHPGPWKAIVTSHQDPTYMGSLEVVLDKAVSGNIRNQNETFVVQYLSPFAGVTSVRFEGNNSADWQDAQKSYGFWAVPPDIGATVMCMFIDGDPNQGYWFGCVVDKFQNHMTPGLAASSTVAITPEQERKYGTRVLPVAEFVKGTRDTSIGVPDTFTKPVHPFADRLLAQGLLLDSVRGVTSSSARRETPSAVFGISTPGPLDLNGRQAMVGYGGKMSKQPISRMGGSTFVMDDGDAEGQNELVRIRTRTGHQILMHNTHDLIYIANAGGTAWIELTGNGKIDIYAKDSVSIHTETDFNFRADRDVNIEAGRNLNISVGANMQTEVGGDNTLMVDGSGKIIYSKDYDETIDSNARRTVGKNMHVGVGWNLYQTAIEEMHFKSDSNLYAYSDGTMHIRSKGNMFQQSEAEFDVKAATTYRETAPTAIHMNSDSQPASIATISSVADPAAIPTSLERYNLPNRSKDAGWDDGKFYKADDITSIMKRVPTHEPWDHHESINRSQFSSIATDRSTDVPTKAQAQSSSSASASSPATKPNPPANYNKADVPADWVKDLPFINKVKDVAKQLNCSYIDLLCCMAFETGRTMSPSITNSIGATGLIQFIPSTARGLGTTTNDLARMSRVEQMDYVLKYFKAGPVAKISAPTLEDLYMQILWPRAVGKSLDYVLFSHPSKAYEQNKGLDANKDGAITKEEAAAKVRNQLTYIRTQLLKVPDTGGVWTATDGTPITDSSGNPIRYGPYPPTN